VIVVEPDRYRLASQACWQKIQIYNTWEACYHSTMFVLTHQIAGINFRTESDVLIPHLQESPFKRFRVGDVKPDVCHRIRRLDLHNLTLPRPDSKERERLSCCVGFQQRWLENPILRSPQVRARLHACLERPDKINFEIAARGVFIRDFASNELDIFYDPELKEYFAGPLVVAGFRNLLANFLPNFSAVMIHSAGVIRNGAVALFLAPDEGGKTTVVKHSNGAPVLNDDQIILRQENNVVISHGTPLGPITSGRQRTKIGGFFLLQKGSHFDLISIKPRDALQFLWNEHLHHWLFLPKSLKIKAFEILGNVCHQAPVYRMRFPKDYVDWDAIDAAMEGKVASKK